MWQRMSRMMLMLTPGPTCVACSAALYDLRTQSANYLTLANNAMSGGAADA